jgi:hypothetical protein
MRRAVPALLVLAAVLVAIFFGCLFRGETLLDSRDLYNYHPWSTLTDEMGVTPVHNVDADSVIQFLPLRAWEARELRAGRFPLWCDDILGGVPLYADANSGMLNPTRAFLLFLSPIRAWELGVAVRFLLAFLFMRMFLRGRGLRESPAILGSLLFTLGALPAFWLRHDQYMWVHAFVPLVAHFAERHGETGRVRFAAYAGVAVATAVLGGALQYGALLLLVGALWLLVRRGWRVWPALGAYVVVALALSMAAWWPALGWMAGAGRDTAADRIFWYPPWHLPTLVAPMIFEDPAAFPGFKFVPDSAQRLFGLVPQARAPFAEATLSVGAVGLLLILLAWRRCRGTWVRAYRNAAVLLVLGTMLAPLAVVVAPWLTVTGIGRFNLLSTFALAAVAAFGLDALSRMDAGSHEALRARAVARLGRLLIGLGILAVMAFVLWTGRDVLVMLARDHLRDELPPFAAFAAHLTGPAVLVPIAALALGIWLIVGRRWGRGVVVTALVAVAAVECLVPALRINRTWPIEWAYPEAAEALLPPAGARALPIGEDVLPGNTPLMYGRATATGYLSAWPAAYAEALYPDGGGTGRFARIPDGAVVDPQGLFVAGEYTKNGWRSIDRSPSTVRASNFHPGWTATVDGVERTVMRHDGWAMRVEPPPIVGQDVRWIFTAPRLRLGLVVGATTGLVLLLLLMIGHVRKGGSA